MPALEIAGFALGAVYAGFLAVCIRGALALRRRRHAPAPGRPAVTVVLPLRNEEAHALATLEALARQDYAGDWEVICVNDRSTDATPRILEEFCAGHPRFSRVDIPPDAPPVAGPKKRALAAGFARARGEVLMTTDADCLPPPSWIRGLASGFDEGVGIVQGPKRIRPGRGLLGRYQEVEVFGLVSIEAASFALGKPLLASAPSLAYRRSLYEAAGGFDGIEHSASGDDDLLVRKMLRRNGFQVRYLADPEACVETGGVASWSALLLQRARWASNGARYEEKGYVATLAGLYLFYAWLLLAPVAASLNWISWDSAIFLWGAKIGLNGVFLGLTAPVLRFQGLWRDHAWSEIFHVPIVLLAVPLGHFGWFRWK